MMDKAFLMVGAVLLIAATPPPSPEAVAKAALGEAPVWDGHNDVAEQLRDRRKDLLTGFDFGDTSATADQAKGWPAMHTDLARLRKGHVGAQFWSVYVSANLPESQAVQATLEQIDVMKRLIAQHPADMQYCADSACVTAAMKAGRIASLLGMEGGHSIGGSLGVLRQMYGLGARYMTLAHFKNNAWADSATDAPAHDGLTPFGKQVVREMQRLGMLVDLSHVSAKTMRDALGVAGAPVIFSHSGARGVDGSPRNVPDDVLDLLKANGGIVMVVSLPGYVSEAVRGWNAARAGEEARLKALNPGDPEVAKSNLADWTKANPCPPATIAQLADHIGHIKARIGINYIGIGGDFDGMETTTQGFDDVSRYPALFAELARRGYTKAELELISSGNILRVLRSAEAYAAQHKSDPPLESATVF